MNNNNARSALKNYFYNTAYQILKIILPIITIPYVSRKLGANNLGIYSYTHSVALYFAMFAYLGFENYGTRIIAESRDNKDKLNSIFSSVYSFQIISSIFAIACYIIYCRFINTENVFVTWIQIFYVVSEIFNVSWLYFGLELFKITAIRSIVVRVISVIAIFAFVKTPNDLILYTLISAGSSLLSSLIIWGGANRYIKFVKISWSDISKHIKGCVVLFFPVLVISIYRTMDKIMLGNISSYIQVAIYNNADKIVEMPFSIIASLGVVMLPRMTSLVTRGENTITKKYIETSMRFMLVCACGMTFGLLAVGKVFAPVFFGDEFIACGDLIMIIAPMIVIRACANVVRTQYLLPNKRDKDYITSIVIGMFINLVLNWLLIPKYGANGAAVATLVCEAFVAIYQIIVCRGEIPVLKYITRNWYFFMSGVVMFVPVYLLGKHLQATISTLCLQIILGIVLYSLFAIPYLMKYEKSLVKKVLKR